MIAQLDTEYVRLKKTKSFARLVSYLLFEGRPVTTRGQWVNPLVFAHFAVEKRLPQIKNVKKPVFILGTGRSGTTVLGVLLSIHRDIGFLNEPKALWHAIYPYEDVIGSYSRKEAKYRLSASDATEKVRRSAYRLYGAYLGLTCSRRVVDKYPELIFRVPFIRAIFPDAKFIFLVRNGWETIASIEKWSQRHGVMRHDEVHDWWGVNQRKWKLMLEELVEPDPYFQDVADDIRSLQRHTDMAAVEWVVTMREGMRANEQHGDCIYRVNYEELISRSREVLEGILQFCELNPDPCFMKYALGKLKPAKPHGQVELHPAILPKFEDTLCSLGY